MSTEPINPRNNWLYAAAATEKNKSSAVAEMSDRGHNRHGPKRGGLLYPFRGGKLGPRLTQCGLRGGLLPYQVVSSSIQPFCHNRHGPKTGGCAPCRRGTETPSNTTSPGLRFTSVPSGILIRPAVFHNRHGPKIAWGCAFFWGSWVPIKNKVAWAEAYLHTKWHLSPSSRLATTNTGGLCPFRGGRAGSPSNTCLLYTSPSPRD